MDKIRKPIRFFLAAWVLISIAACQLGSTDEIETDDDSLLKAGLNPGEDAEVGSPDPIYDDLEEILALAVRDVRAAYVNPRLISERPDVVPRKLSEADESGEAPPYHIAIDENDRRIFAEKFGLNEETRIAEVRIIEDRRTQEDTGCIMGWCQDESQNKKALRVQAAIAEKDNERILKAVEKEITVSRSSFSTYFAFWDSNLLVNPGSCFIVNGGKIHTNANFFLNPPHDHWGESTCPDSADGTRRIYGTYLEDTTISVHRFLIRNTYAWPRASAYRPVMINGHKLTAVEDHIDVLNDPYDDLYDSGFMGYHIMVDEGGDYIDPTTWQVNPDWHEHRIATWGDKVLDEAPARPGPDIHSLSEDGPYAGSANVKIIVESDGSTVQVTRTTGTPPAEDLNYLCGIEDERGQIEQKMFWDDRENLVVQALVIDVAKLTSAECMGTDSGGLVYASRRDAVPDATPKDPFPDPDRVPNGFLFKNASVLEQPLSFVTNNPLYLLDEFNKEKTELGEASWKPALLMADAITALSPAFYFSTTPIEIGTWPPPPAASGDFEFNAVFVSGMRWFKLLSNGDWVNGEGLPDLIRLLEDWSENATANFRTRGAYINLWESEFATGRFNKNNGWVLFMAPPAELDMQHDTRLLLKENQPPGDILGVHEEWATTQTWREIPLEAFEGSL